MNFKVFLFLIIFTFSSSLFAEIYVCLDVDGRKTFSDSDCEKLALKYLNPRPLSVPVVPAQNQIQRPVLPIYQSQSYVKPPEKRVTNFAYIWDGAGYTGFLRYFFLFIVGGALLFLLFYLVLYIKDRARKRTSGIVDAKY